MQQPTYLKKGDKIALVAPAGKISFSEVELAVKKLKSWGLEVVIGKTVGGEYNRFSGTDEERKQDFQNALDDDSIQAIFFARGGYGCIRIVNEIDFSRFQQHPKWLVGLSDITIFHNHINTNFDIATLHATMPISFGRNSAEGIESLRQFLFGENLSYTVPSSELNRGGKAIAEIVGGNLATLYSLFGSDSEVDSEGKILFLEEIGEHLYNIDRMLVSLKRAGKLKNLKGLIVGSFTETKDNEDPFGKTVEEIILEHTSEYDYPICFDFPAGHADDNRALPFGVKAELSVVSDNCQLSIIN